MQGLGQCIWACLIYLTEITQVPRIPMAQRQEIMAGLQPSAIESKTQWNQQKRMRYISEEARVDYWLLWTRCLNPDFKNINISIFLGIMTQEEGGENYQIDYAKETELWTGSDLVYLESAWIIDHYWVPIESSLMQKLTFYISEDMSVKFRYIYSYTFSKQNRIQCLVYFAITILGHWFNKDLEAIPLEK